MKLTIPAFCLSLLIPMAAHAGKAERDAIAENVEPAMAAAKDALKKNCSADVKFVPNYDSFKTVDELNRIMLTSRTITEGTAKYCSDKATKAVIGKLKVIEFSKTDKAGVTYANGKAIFTTEGQTFFDWDALAREIDK